jgi:hypothetical protein
VARKVSPERKRSHASFPMWTDVASVDGGEATLHDGTKVYAPDLPKPTIVVSTGDLTGGAPTTPEGSLAARLMSVEPVHALPATEAQRRAIADYYGSAVIVDALTERGIGATVAYVEAVVTLGDALRSDNSATFVAAFRRVVALYKQERESK